MSRRISRQIRGGFTLVELLVVLVIIAILIAVPALETLLEREQDRPLWDGVQQALARINAEPSPSPGWRDAPEPALRLTAFVSGQPRGGEDMEAERDRGVELIKKLGGSYQADENAPGKPIVTVDLSGTKADDADVAALKGFTRLRALNLNLTKVTDRGLVHLKGMTQLEELGLGLTAVGDAGMAHLKGLIKLQRMDLRATKLTDVGLGHLKTLKDLQVVDVDGSPVTAAGVNDLRKALPKVEVIRQKKPHSNQEKDP